MNSDVSPPDPLTVLARVALVVADIQERDDRDNDVLLTDFLRTAWPSPRGQRQ
jgi:hypothetical protein